MYLMISLSNIENQLHKILVRIRPTIQDTEREKDESRVHAVHRVVRRLFVRLHDSCQAAVRRRCRFGAD